MSSAQDMFASLIAKTNEFIRQKLPASAHDTLRDDKVILSTISKTTQQPRLIQNCSMRDYQIDGLNWMIKLYDHGISGILADEMGLGKTLQTISLLAYLKENRGVNGPHIVLVPLSTLGNWCNELARFCPALRVCKFHGPREVREELLETVIFPQEFDVLVTTYEVVNMEKAALRKIQWEFMIVDEAHRLKNENSRLARHAREFKTRNRLLVTGTPLQNSLHELWALLNFLLPSIFSSSEAFDAMFAHVEETAGVVEDSSVGSVKGKAKVVEAELEDKSGEGAGKKDGKSGGSHHRHHVEEEVEEVEEVEDTNDDVVMDEEAKVEMLHKLHEVLRPFMLRRLKSDVSTNLPPKKELLVYIGMTKMQKDLYKKILAGNMDAIAGNGVQHKKLMNVVMQLRKAVNHPYLFPGVEDENLDPLGEHLVQNSGKMIVLDKLLKKLKSQGSRVLIFSQMTTQLDILQDFCTMRGYQCCRIDGNTSTEDREIGMTEFNKEGSEKFVFLLSTRAGGLGINLYTADIVILYDSDWNPQADLQAMDRAHRLGQKKPVFVYRFVTQHSIEERITMRAESKLRLDAMVIQQGSLAQTTKKLGNNEMINMIRCGAEDIFNAVDMESLDEDIDNILKKGMEKTEELNAKISKFSGFNLSLSASHDELQKQVQQEEELEEISEETRRKLNEQALALAAEAAAQEEVLGKRERLHSDYGQDRYFREVTGAASLSSRNRHLIRPLKVPKMQDFQLYDIARITQLCDKESQYYTKWIHSNDTAPHASGLSEEEIEERNVLLSMGFPNWISAEYKAFLKATEKYGKNNFSRIHEDIPTKSLNEIETYAEAFWLKNHLIRDVDKALRAIEAGEKKLKALGEMRPVISHVIEDAEDADMARVHNNYRMKATLRGRGYQPEDDVLLLYHAQHQTLTDGKRLRNVVWEDEDSMFNYFLLSRTGTELCRRTEMVMKGIYEEVVGKRRRVEKK